MKINRKSVSNLEKKQNKKLNNVSNQRLRLVTERGTIIAFSYDVLDPYLLAEDFPTYAYIPYNKNWGIKEEIHKIKVMIRKDGLGIAKNGSFSPELFDAIQKKLGNISSTSEVTFHFHPDGMMIDVNSFEIVKDKTEEGTPKMAELSVPIFISPEGQKWAQEINYREYADSQEAVYECSDGSFVSSYQQFRDWEKELAYHLENPEPLSYQESQKTLSSIGYLEFSNDGTIWRNQILLGEYLHWLEDKDYGFKDGFYVGFYGICSSFEEYVRINNSAYFVNEGLRREEQFLGANGFLYSSSRKAHQSLEGMRKSHLANAKKIKTYS